MTQNGCGGDTVQKNSFAHIQPTCISCQRYWQMFYVIIISHSIIGSMTFRRKDISDIGHVALEIMKIFLFCGKAPESFNKKSRRVFRYRKSNGSREGTFQRYSPVSKQLRITKTQSKELRTSRTQNLETRDLDVCIALVNEHRLPQPKEEGARREETPQDIQNSNYEHCHNRNPNKKVLRVVAKMSYGIRKLEHLFL